MGIWRKIFICNNHKGMWLRGRRIYVVEEELVWIEEMSKAVVFKILQVYDRKMF